MKPDFFIPIPLEKPDDHCYLCSRNRCEAVHLTSVDHLKYAVLADKYLDFCQQNNLNPVSCGENDLTLFLETRLTGKNDENSRATILKVFEKLHDPIDGKDIGEIPSLAKLLTVEESSLKKGSVVVVGTKSLKMDTSVSGYEGLSKQESDIVSTCPVCQKTFGHATSLVRFELYHKCRVNV